MDSIRHIMSLVKNEHRRPQGTRPMTATRTNLVHTPGPWKIDGGEGKKGELYVWTERDEDGKGYIGSHEVCVAVVQGRRFNEGQDCTREEIYEADARLIAAAPELLAA